MGVSFIFSYEPELFPGLIYRLVQPRVVLLIFVSGKIVLTGKLIFHIFIWLNKSNHRHLMHPYLTYKELNLKYKNIYYFET